MPQLISVGSFSSDVPIVGKHSRWAPPTAGVHVVSSQLLITERLRLSCVATSRREPGSLMAATAATAAMAAMNRMSAHVGMI